jgi:signal peptidase II
MNARPIVVLIGVTALVDQLSKALALSKLALGEPVAIVPGFNLTLGFNEGASFGMLSSVMTGKPLLMAALTGAVTVILVVIAFRARSPLERAGFSLIVGGGLGNIIDRVRHGAVTDFLDLYWRDWHWPSFNAADIAISVGVLCIVAASLSVGTPRSQVRKIDSQV